MAGIARNGVVGAKCHVEAVKNLVKRVLHIFGVDALHLFFVLLVEMRLNRHHVVVVVNRERARPRMVGTGNVDCSIATSNGNHD